MLVHGLAGSSGWWRDTENVLAERFDVHALDLPGFGSARRARFALDEAPAMLAARLAEVGRAHLVGHSLGGLLCARVAARNPELVERLVLVAPAGALPRRTLAAHVRPLAVALGSASPAFVRRLVADALRAGPRTLVRTSRELLRDDVLPELGAIRAPTLLIWGERDPLVPPAVADTFRSAIPDARIAMLADVHHVPMVERPREFASLLAEFFA